MTKNQIELIKAREMERSNRAQEELASQGQNKSLAGSVIGSLFRGLATTLIPSPKGKAKVMSNTVHHIVQHHYNRSRFKQNKEKEGNNNNG